MASESKAEPTPDLHTCQICQFSLQPAAVASHERGLQHQAARQVAAVALDRWRAHMAAEPGPEAVEDTADPGVDTVIFCVVCTEAVPSSAYPRHLTSKAHLTSALDEQELEELVRSYAVDEDLKLLEAPAENDEDGRSTAKASKAEPTYTCHMCALEVAVVFKNDHERSVHHRTRVALASAAARRTSAFLHAAPTPLGVPGTIKMTELLKAYTGIDLMKKKDIEVEIVEEVVEKETQEKASQIEVKKRLTAKQYFTDILPYLQYTEALYTLIIDDTDYVTIKNTYDTYLRIHVTNFNGLYSNEGGVHYKMKCKLCNGRDQNMSYSSDKDYDKLHVMSLGHIRHVLTPIDNVHGIRKIDNGQSHCVLCNAYLLDHGIENHVFNDIHHTAALAEALKRGKTFKESKDDLKIVIYYAAPVDTGSFYMRNPVRNFDSVLNGNVHLNNGLFRRGGGVSFPQGGDVAFPAGGGNVTTQQVGSLFGSQQSTALGTTAATNASPAFGASPASSATFGTNSASTGAFGVNTANASPFGVNSASPTFGASPASGSTFGTNSASTGAFGVNTANASPFGVNSASPAFGASTANTATFGVNSVNPSPFGVNTTSTTASVFGARTPSTGTFGASPANTGFGTATATGKTGTNPNNAKTGLFGSTSGNLNVTSTTSTGNVGGTFFPPKGGSVFGAAPTGTTAGNENSVFGVANSMGTTASVPSGATGNGNTIGYKHPS